MGSRTMIAALSLLAACRSTSPPTQPPGHDDGHDDDPAPASASASAPAPAPASASAPAPLPRSGRYGAAEVAVEPVHRGLTLHYRNARGEPDPRTKVPPFTCAFMVAARLKGDGPTYEAVAIFDGKPHRATLTVESKDALRIRYEGEPGGCVSTAGPELGGGLDASGLRLERDGDGRKDTLGWRAIAAPRCFFRAKTDAPATAAYALKGDVVRVDAESPGWVHGVHERWNGNETSGWLRSDELFPLP